MDAIEKPVTLVKNPLPISTLGLFMVNEHPPVLDSALSPIKAAYVVCCMPPVPDVPTESNIVLSQLLFAKRERQISKLQIKEVLLFLGYSTNPFSFVSLYIYMDDWDSSDFHVIVWLLPSLC